MDCGRLKELAIIMRLLFIFLLQLQCNLFVTESFDRSNLKNLNFTLPDGTSLDPKYWNKGKSVIYFGFSHCPDMCPFALTNFGRASMILGPLAREFRFVFITLDPERDAPSVLASYVNQFPGKNLQALSPANTSLLELELYSVSHVKRLESALLTVLTIQILYTF